MFAKSIKHLLKTLFRQTSTLYQADLVSHLLNCVFSSEKVLSALESNDVKELLEQNEKSDQVAGNQKSSQEEEAKKKKKKKKANNGKKEKETNTFVSPLLDFGSIKSESESAEFLNLKPSDIWTRIRDICKKRYLYDLPEKFADFEPLHYPLTKIATLRDVCISSGIVLSCKTYQLFDKINAKEESKKDESSAAETLSFKSQDILDIQPVVKHLDPGCDDAKVQVDLVIIFMILY